MERTNGIVRQQTGRWHRRQNKFSKLWEQTEITARLVVSYFSWIWQHSRTRDTAAQRARFSIQPWVWHGHRYLSHVLLRHNRIERGIEQGIERGIEQGRKVEKLEIARSLLDRLPIEVISQATGLTADEIAQLQADAELEQ